MDISNQWTPESVQTDDLYVAAAPRSPAPSPDSADKLPEPGAKFKPRRMYIWPWLTRLLSVSIALILLAPLLMVVAVGCWATVAFVRLLLDLGNFFATGHSERVIASFGALNLLGRTALICGVYLMLVCALLMLAIGAHQRGWRRIFLPPGFLLCLITGLIFFYALRFAAPVVLSELHWNNRTWLALSAYGIAAAVLLAGYLGGVGLTSGQRAWVRRVLHIQRHTSAQAPLARPMARPVHDGPLPQPPPLMPITRANEPAPNAPIFSPRDATASMPAGNTLDDHILVSGVVDEPMPTAPPLKRVAAMLKSSFRSAYARAIALPSSFRSIYTRALPLRQGLHALRQAVTTPRHRNRPPASAP